MTGDGITVVGIAMDLEGVQPARRCYELHPQDERRTANQRPVLKVPLLAGPIVCIVGRLLQEWQSCS